MVVSNPAALAGELNLLLTTESHGLSDHLRQATPYLSAQTYAVWRTIEHMLGANAHHAARLSALLARNELPERPAPFAQQVAHFHFTDVQHLLGPLIDEKRTQIEAYERAIEHAGGTPDIVAELEAMLTEHRAQLEALEKHRAATAAANPT